ncbi:MAG: hypothetical protein JWM62_844, partial [Frankiales bacterium]|nr:hypothetical protein [Frankiales bacterium]
GARGPAPVAGPGGPGVVPGGATPPVAPAVEEAPEGPPREAEAPSTLRAVPPLTQDGAPVGAFTVVRPAEADSTDR